VAEAAPPDGLSARPAGGRYRLPDFAAPPEDEGVN
jgi:hypothetical protein